MNSRYSIFASYYGSYASQYEEDAIHLLYIIQSLNPEAHITFAQLDGALIRSGLSPRSLYEQAEAGRYTSDMARLDIELGLPAKATTPECVGYWQQQLVEMAKRDGKSQEIIDGIDADLDRALASGLGYYFNKEHLAWSIIRICEAFDFEASITKIQNMTGQSTEDIKAISDNLLKMAEATPEPTKPASKAPYYQKDKQQWWK